MKSVVFLGDGMADRPWEELQGRTPLELARHPYMDALARRGLFGLTRTIPEGMIPGSDVGNLAVFGYDPRRWYSGRSSLEAVGMGIPLGEADVTWRCNLVTLTGGESLEESTMADFSAGGISTGEAREMLEDFWKENGLPGLELHTGKGYRHCLVGRGLPGGAVLTQPHDIVGQPVKNYLPRGEHAALLRSLMERSRVRLKNHPVNVRRRRLGLPEGNALWFWGEGRRPALPDFGARFGVRRPAAVSATDLVRGIARCAGVELLPAAGIITAGFDTDYRAKGKAAIAALGSGSDFVYIHLGAPDECAHRGAAQEKIGAIESMDREIVGPVMTYLEQCGLPWSVLLTPDHATPLALRNHTAEPVPYVLARSDEENRNNPGRYCEKDAPRQEEAIPAWELMQKLIRK